MFFYYFIALYFTRMNLPERWRICFQYSKGTSQSFKRITSPKINISFTLNGDSSGGNSVPQILQGVSFNLMEFLYMLHYTGGKEGKLNQKS